MNQIHNLYLKGKEFKLDNEDCVQLNLVTDMLNMPEEEYEKLLFVKEKKYFCSH